jgi:predicted membrane protein (TIGR00267 family)
MSKPKSKFKTYDEITNFSLIARRYFINNFYDGILTVFGILLGFFVLILKDLPQPSISSIYILLTGLSTSITMFFSGISGSYLSEKAEQKKMHTDLEKAMGLLNNDLPEERDIEEEQREIEKAMLKQVRLKREKRKKDKRKQVKSIYRKAENFASIVVAFVNGFAPFLGGLMPLIPFFIVTEANFITFLFSFIIIFFCIIFLGIFVGRISKESKIKSILQMLFAFTLTMVIVILFLG